VRLQHLFFIAVASAALTFSALPQERPPRVALVIGNASYPDASSTLSTTISDARAIADEFRGNNFDVDLKENVGNEDMRRTVDAFLNKIRNGASALLYFNGIGIQVETPNGTVTTTATGFAFTNSVTGPTRICVAGGTYLDEATNATQTNTMTLCALVGGATTQVFITPMSSFVDEIVKAQLKLNPNPTAADFTAAVLDVTRL